MRNVFFFACFYTGLLSLLRDFNSTPLFSSCNVQRLGISRTLASGETRHADDWVSVINAATGTCARYTLSAGKDGGLGLPGRALKVKRTLGVREGEAHFGQRQHRLRRRPRIKGLQQQTPGVCLAGASCGGRRMRGSLTQKLARTCITRDLMVIPRPSDAIMFCFFPFSCEAKRNKLFSLCMLHQDLCALFPEDRLY